MPAAVGVSGWKATQLSPAAENGNRSVGPMTQELRQDILRRVHAVQQHYHRGGPVLRAVWVLAAILVTVTGIAMTVLPGPAVLVVPLGLAMLAVRYRWAHAVLHSAIEHGVRAQRRVAAGASPGSRVLWGIGCVVMLVALGLVVLR